jgi:excisionase family DNA binding protein
MEPVTASYPVGTVASLLKVSRAVCLRLIKDGDLVAERTPQGLRVPHGQLMGWIDAQMDAAAQEAHGLAKDP